MCILLIDQFFSTSFRFSHCILCIFEQCPSQVNTSVICMNLSKNKIDIRGGRQLGTTIGEIFSDELFENYVMFTPCSESG